MLPLDYATKVSQIGTHLSKLRFKTRDVTTATKPPFAMFYSPTAARASFIQTNHVDLPLRKIAYYRGLHVSVDNRAIF